MTVGRNEPCPCGSGRKYKKCCMLVDAARRDELTPRSINRCSEEAVHALVAHARRLHGEGFFDAARQAIGCEPKDRYAREDPLDLLVVPWALYLWDPVGGPANGEGAGTVAADFLKSPAAMRIGERTRRFMQACRREPVTFWQVEAVERGAGMSLRDLATHRECFIHERSATETVVAWDIMFGQVVEVDGIRTLSMSGPYALPAGRFRGKVERFLAAKIDPERLLAQDRELITFYLTCAEELLNPVLPELRNTEGDRLEWTTSVFRFDPAQGDRLLGRLDQMRNIEACSTEEEIAAEYVWLSQGKGPLEQVSRARLKVQEDRLVTESNSRKRDRQLRTRLLKGLGDLVEHVETTHRPLDWDAIREAPTAESESESGSLDLTSLPPESRAQIQQMMDAMHMRWADQPVPALGGQTPRDAVKTAAGRREVAQLLNDFDNSQRRARNPHDAFDYNRLRGELGLELE